MKYKKIIINKPGGSQDLQMTEDEITTVKDNMVLIKISAAGVAFADVLMREGVYPGMPEFPINPGYDIIGNVVSIGENVKSIKTGQTVAALTKTGGYAEYIMLPESELVPVPDGLDESEAVSLVLNYVTAWQMLHRAVTLKKNDSVLIHGAAGGVGTAFLQIGRLMGLKIYGTASAGKHDLVKSLGGIPIDYNNENVYKFLNESEPDGIAAAFDGTGEWVYPSYKALRSDGSLVVFGASSMLNRGRKSLWRTIRVYLRFSIFLKNMFPGKKKIFFYTITDYMKKHPEWFNQDLRELFDLLKNEKIKPVIAMRKPLSEAAHCHELLNSSSITGKIVLLPPIA